MSTLTRKKRKKVEHDWIEDTLAITELHTNILNFKIVMLC